MISAAHHRTTWADPQHLLSSMPVLARIKAELIARGALVPPPPPKPKRRYERKKETCSGT